MANGFTIVTNRDNTFFTNNKMTVGSGIPTSGSYKVGDIVISDSQSNGIFGWVCTQEGTPGKWEIIGSGNADFSEVEAKIGDLPTLQTTAKDSLVDAINELFQNANNGKELIATAIGDPLNSSDTFSAMSTGINNLNSQFKAALMNNGVSIEGTDKFKQLIDKLALLADSEGKGIQYAEGTYDDFWEYLTTSGTTVEVPYELNFTPTLLFVKFNYIHNSNGTTITNAVISNKGSGQFYMNRNLSFNIGNISSNGFSMVFRYGDNSNITFEGVTWYAIGVGEEDNTLRDSLASILQAEGVNVTPEDNMASLITKVDTAFDNLVPKKTSLYNRGVENTTITLSTDNGGQQKNEDHLYLYGVNFNGALTSGSLTVDYKYNPGDEMKYLYIDSIASDSSKLTVLDGSNSIIYIGATGLLRIDLSSYSTFSSFQISTTNRIQIYEIYISNM